LPGTCGGFLRLVGRFPHPGNVMRRGARVKLRAGVPGARLPAFCRSGVTRRRPAAWTCATGTAWAVALSGNAPEVIGGRARKTASPSRMLPESSPNRARPGGPAEVVPGHRRSEPTDRRMAGPVPPGQAGCVVSGGIGGRVAGTTGAIAGEGEVIATEGDVLSAVACDWGGEGATRARRGTPGATGRCGPYRWAGCWGAGGLRSRPPAGLWRSGRAASGPACRHAVGTRPAGWPGRRGPP